MFGFTLSHAFFYFLVTETLLSYAAFQITSPVGGAIWASNSPNAIGYTRNASDPMTDLIAGLLNFNLNSSKDFFLLGNFDMLANDTTGSLPVTPPASGFPVGIVQVVLEQQRHLEDDSNLPVITLAKSEAFTIVQGDTVPSSLMSAGPTSTAPVPVSSPSMTSSVSSVESLPVPSFTPNSASSLSSAPSPSQSGAAHRNTPLFFASTSILVIANIACLF